LEAYPAQTIKVMSKALRSEWQDPTSRQQPILYHLSQASTLHHELEPMLRGLLLGTDTPNEHTGELGLRIAAKFDHAMHGPQIERVALSRLESARDAGDVPRVAIDLALLIRANPSRAVREVRECIQSTSSEQRPPRAVMLMARLFGRDRSLAVDTLKGLPVPPLAELCRLCYAEVSPLDDPEHEGCYSPDTRDDAASARNSIFSALLDRTEQLAFDAVLAVATSGIPGVRPTRFRELAHGMAERSSELAAWSPLDICTFETHYLLPISTGHQLMDAVCETLNEIKRGFMQDDAGPRRLVARAVDEAEVQEWLAGELKTRSRDRFHIHREPQVAARKMPDIVVSSTTIANQIAIEIKHANKGWTLKDLEGAVVRQLVGRYLHPTERRHGILVVSLHARRTWRDTSVRKSLSFDQVIDRLNALAAKVKRNATGDVTVSVIGIDATVAS
jgi:hypothetical protein